MSSLLQNLSNIGVSRAKDLQDERRRRFMNSMNVVGFLVACSNAVLLLPFNGLSSLIHLGWGILCLVAIAIHHFHSFELSKLVTFTAVILLGNLASALIGPEALPHLASLGIIVAVYMMYNIPEDWKIILVFTILEISCLLLVESRILQVTTLPDDFVYSQRLFTIIGTPLFVIFEFVFFMKIIRDKDREVIHSLQKLNAENQLLLKEVHHRVKNNLQLVSSLLRMQESTIDDPKVSAHFTDAYSRIQSISLLHQKVYQGNRLGEIDFEDYLRTVAKEIIQTYTPDSDIALSIQSKIKRIENDSLFPIALIFNELITNTIKHALKDRKSGAISIDVVPQESGYKMTYLDSGEWVEPQKAHSIGHELIRSLAEQMDGSFEIIHTGNKAEFVIYFKL
jgi:two-component system, sensor histidine kinase PdtaS